MVEGGGTVRSTVGLEKPRFWSLGALPSSEKLPLLLPYWDEDNDDDASDPEADSDAIDEVAPVEDMTSSSASAAPQTIAASWDAVKLFATPGCVGDDTVADGDELSNPARAVQVQQGSPSSSPFDAPSLSESVWQSSCVHSWPAASNASPKSFVAPPPTLLTWPNAAMPGTWLPFGIRATNDGRAPELDSVNENVQRPSGSFMAGEAGSAELSRAGWMETGQSREKLESDCREAVCSALACTRDSRGDGVLGMHH